VPGSAIKLSADRKFKTYARHFDERCYTLFPLVIECFGRIGPHFEALIDAFVVAELGATEDASATRGYCMQGWRQRISIALQSIVSATVDTGMRRSVTRAGAATPPDPSGYERVQLLLGGGALLEAMANSDLDTS